MKARLPQGMGGGGMNNMLQRAQKMQEEMAAKQAELEDREYSASAGGGMVEATVSGKHMVKSIKIKPEAVDPDDIEMLEDLVTAAINAAINEAETTAAAEMEKITSGFNIPGMPGLF